MEEARPAADPAYSTSITVILAAVLVVEQIAHQTGILPEPDAALFALGLDALPGVALGADQLRDRLSVEKMRLVLVVTVPAHVELVTARCHKLGPPFIMRTANALFIRILLRGAAHRLGGRILLRRRHLKIDPAAAAAARYASDFRETLGNAPPVA